MYFLTGGNSTSFPDAQVIVEANNALDRVSSLIMQADGRWQWDDQNQTDLPIATTTLTASQQDYTLAVTHNQIVRAEVKDNASTPTWHKLTPIDQADVFDQSLTSFMSTVGLPTYYDKIGNSFFLYPAPSYTQAASLKVWFKRPPSYFLTSDTTKSPGFNSLYHELIPLWVAYNFAVANGKGNANALMEQIQLKEDALKEDYALRDKDDRLQLRARPMNWN